MSIQVGAQIAATTRGSDTGMLIGSVAGVALLVASCLFAAAFPVLLYAGGLTGILMAGGCGFSLFVGRRNRHQVELPPTEIIVGDDSVSSAQIDGVKDISRLITLLQNRKQLPAPHGRVDGPLDDPSALKPYSDDQKRSFLESQAHAESDLDRALLGRVEEVACGVRESDPHRADLLPPVPIGSIGPKK